MMNKSKNPAEISSAALAYLGDSVIEIRVREFLVSCGLSHAADLNAAALDFVRASAQSDAVENILPILTEGEAAAFRRGRNIGHTNTPKSATALQYRRATGMEALFGYLRLTGQEERADELFSFAYADIMKKYKGDQNVKSED
ncbi:MAG: ribonuclease III [Ruminococcaceae bacterium]|nr:ribonuclease III [Oscillospiraceae bacterium]